ncbi:MAG: TonB family protein [Flavobacterium sp.]|nr:MAG: TonB family protein [Flavobacterium sp.]
MKINPYLIFFVLFASFAFAQGENDRKVYFDSLWKETESDDYTYYRIIKDYNSTKSEYQVADYFRSGKPQMTGTFADREGKVKTGEFVWFYENGNKKNTTTYKLFNNGRSFHPTGETTSWYENGNKKIEAEFLVTETVEKISWKYRIKNYWDENNVQQTKDGNGSFVEDEDKLFRETGKIKDGSRDGIWIGKGLKTKKNFSFEDIYDNGNLVSGVMTDSIGVKHTYNQIVVSPKPRKGLEHFYKFISKKFRFPRNDNGQIVVSFIIDKNGDATDLKVIKSMGDDFDNEAIRVIKAYPDWQPGKFRGMDSKTIFSIPITIKTQ